MLILFEKLKLPDPEICSFEFHEKRAKEDTFHEISANFDSDRFRDDIQNFTENHQDWQFFEKNGETWVRCADL